MFILLRHFGETNYDTVSNSACLHWFNMSFMCVMCGFRWGAHARANVISVGCQVSAQFPAWLHHKNHTKDLNLAQKLQALKQRDTFSSFLLPLCMETRSPWCIHAFLIYRYFPPHNLSFLVSESEECILLLLCVPLFVLWKYLWFNVFFFAIMCFKF